MTHKLEHSDIVEAIGDWLAKKGIEVDEKEIVVKGSRKGGQLSAEVSSE